jgi:hypothetical protein
MDKDAINHYIIKRIKQKWNTETLLKIQTYYSDRTPRVVSLSYTNNIRKNRITDIRYEQSMINK